MFDGTRKKSRTITQRNIALKLHINHFCLSWNSNDIRLISAMEELTLNFKVVDDVISDQHVKKFIKYEYKHIKKFNLN